MFHPYHVVVQLVFPFIVKQSLTRRSLRAKRLLMWYLFSSQFITNILRPMFKGSRTRTRIVFQSSIRTTRPTISLVALPTLQPSWVDSKRPSTHWTQECVPLARKNTRRLTTSSRSFLQEITLRSNHSAITCATSTNRTLDLVTIEDTKDHFRYK